MSLPRWHEEPIGKSHDRQGFDCGDESLNSFLYRHARQSHERGGAKTFLAINDADSRAVLGFYSLAPVSLQRAAVPDVVSRGLARHDVPGFRLARLATDLRFQGKGLGGQLIAAAARRCLRAATEVGGVILVIDAKNDRAAQWYTSYGAIALRDVPLTLVLPLARLERELRASGAM
jgi:GNAT superfamily N-acetyltransferase